MKKFINYFLQGLLYIVPISVTLYVVYWTFIKIDGILPFQFPGLGLIAIIALITFIGFAGSAIIASPINSFFQGLLKKAPLLQTIYTSMKDLMRTFVGKKKGFDQAVLIKLYENSTIERIGFITNEDLSSLGIKGGKILVYLPHSYAFSGQLFVVEKSYITPIDKSSSEIMKLIVSGGVTEIEK
ncbi:MAG: DUF502 domain-containing protein [Flavobacteriales bacterium]|nr:DUF502 domain-containing protein [Flavobacteriales bacterium]MDG1348874.1 DUF502 domain-containing protein [Flavobacteriales bacterium]|tara:strand:- start:521 stop:1072 length:552 start_codon:yes stop_codon:yes gene_type:complete